MNGRVEATGLWRRSTWPVFHHCAEVGKVMRTRPPAAWGWADWWWTGSSPVRS